MGDVAGLVPVTPDRPGHEQVQDDERDRADVERDDEGVVDRAPVGGDRSHPPRAEQVKQDRPDHQQRNSDRNIHRGRPLQRTRTSEEPGPWTSRTRGNQTNCIGA